MSEATPSEAERPVLPVAVARAQLARALNELDDRLSLKRSLERHPVAWAVGGGVALLAIAGAVTWAFLRDD